MMVQESNVALVLPWGALLRSHTIISWINQICQPDISNSKDAFTPLHQSPPGSKQHFCEGWEYMHRASFSLSLSKLWSADCHFFCPCASLYYRVWSFFFFLPLKKNDHQRWCDLFFFSFPFPKVRELGIINLFCFSSKRYFFSIFELKYLFGSARVWKHMNKIWKNQIACLFVPAVVHNHLSSSSFCVFRIGGVLVFVKDQGLSRVFGFPSFGCFWVSSFDVFEFPSWKVIVLVFWLWTAWGPVLRFGAFPLLLLCVSGRFPSFFCSSPLFHTHYSKIYTHTHYTLTVLSLRTPLNNIHTYTPIAAVLFIN